MQLSQLPQNFFAGFALIATVPFVKLFFAVFGTSNPGLSSVTTLDLSIVMVGFALVMTGLAQGLAATINSTCSCSCLSSNDNADEQLVEED